MNVGVDLGTTNTLCCYINESGNLCRIEFKNGKRGEKYLLPSCVAISDNGIVVGQPALDIEKTNPGAVLRNTKYHMGTDKYWKAGRVTMYARDVAEYILKEVMAELKAQFPQEESFSALVTVPARFDTQPPRQQTKEALASAGFLFDNENALMDEPLAAAVAYSNSLRNSKIVLVVDIGGGTFDLSLLHSDMIGAASSNNRVNPVAWDGDMFLGGNDADKLILGMILDKVEEDGKATFIKGIQRTDPRAASYNSEVSNALSRLADSTADIKKQLYDPDTDSAYVYFEDLLPGYDCDMEITKEQYIEAASNMAGKMRDKIESIFQHSGYTPEETDSVIVVGGMAREICLNKILIEMFGKEKVFIPDDSMFLVARGAAICNSNLRMHVVSKAYSNIGILIHDETDVDVLIHEGDEITQDFRVERMICPSENKASRLTIKIVEFKGSFERKKCSVVNNTTILLQKKLLAREQKIHGVFTLNKDNLLNVEYTQIGGASTIVSVRL